MFRPSIALECALPTRRHSLAPTTASRLVRRPPTRDRRSPFSCVELARLKQDLTRAQHRAIYGRFSAPSVTESIQRTPPVLVGPQKPRTAGVGLLQLGPADEICECEQGLLICRIHPRPPGPHMNRAPRHSEHATELLPGHSGSFMKPTHLVAGAPRRSGVPGANSLRPKAHAGRLSCGNLRRERRNDCRSWLDNRRATDRARAGEQYSDEESFCPRGALCSARSRRLHGTRKALEMQDALRVHSSAPNLSMKTGVTAQRKNLYARRDTWSTCSAIEPLSNGVAP